MSKITCNMKTIAYTEFCRHVLFSFFWVSYNIVKFDHKFEPSVPFEGITVIVVFGKVYTSSFRIHVIALH